MDQQPNVVSFGIGSGRDGREADLGEAAAPTGASLLGSLDLLKDVPLKVTVELGRARLSIRDVLALRSGSVVELDRPAGAAVDILVNGVLIARGEVVVVDERFGVRISEIVGPVPVA